MIRRLPDLIYARRRLAGALLAVCLLAGLPPRVQADMALSQVSPKLSLAASLRVRGEFWTGLGGRRATIPTPTQQPLPSSG